MAQPLAPARRVVLAVGALLVAATWFTWLRPVALGGDVSYVVVQGTSMEPTYEDGDLVLVRQEAKYSHGDIIAFRAGGTFDDPTRIIHRIVGDAGSGRFHTQGDNRDRIDPWEPGPDDIIGRAELHVPKAGGIARSIARPEMFAALGGAAVVAGGERRRRRRRGARRIGSRSSGGLMPPLEELGARGSVGRAAPSRLGRFTEPRWAFIGLLAALVLAVPVLAMAWSALRAPDATQRVEQVGQVDYGVEPAYRFTGQPSAVYPDGKVTTTRNAAGAVVPDGPLYSRLLDRLDVDLAFRATQDGTGEVDATYAVSVDVRTPSGWSTPIEVIDATPLHEAATEKLSLDLRAVAAKVADVSELTGVSSESYTITVAPTLDIRGTVDGDALHEHTDAPMTFAVENNVITANVVAASDRHELTRTVDERAHYSIGPLSLGTQAARGVLGGLALVLVAAIAWFASVLFGGVGLDEPARIAARYRSQMIDVEGAAAPPGPVVMVSGIDELARIAKVEQTVMLHEDQGDGAHRYRVFLGSVTYEYEAAPEHAGAAAAAAPSTDEGGA